ncbi:DsbA family protein [Nitrospira sp. BLG_2]|uniref:DsbA family protein n=1 Tax=Nitrospira sp. BLG_2 TaxID=3397507 RepID=UPI003B9CB63D
MSLWKGCAYLVFVLVASSGSLVGHPETADAQTSRPDGAEADLKNAVEEILRQHPNLILRALEHDPVVLADLVERGAELRKAKVEEAQWQAELANPKVPRVAENRPIRGERQAPVTIVEYSDFECPYCRAVAPTLQEILSEYGESVRLVYKHNPLSFHATAEPAARYFEAIALQSEEQAWRFHDMVFQQQRNLSRGVEVLREIAADLEIDHGRMRRDLESDQVTQRIAADRAEASQFGFDGTPAFVINGVSLIGNHPKRDFDRIIKKILPETQAMVR